MSSGGFRVRRSNAHSRNLRRSSIFGGLLLLGTSQGFVTSPITSRAPIVHGVVSPSKLPMSAVADGEVEAKTQKFRPNPVVVSAEAEALSHSETTMKLTPSYDLFQLLDESEGGEVPATISGNAMRDGAALKVNGEDPLAGLKLSSFVGLGGKKKIETQFHTHCVNCNSHFCTSSLSHCYCSP